ncbi:MAG TPA: HAD hydrolase-like protein [Candidatus Thermoplasmatota archaeon]
MLLVDLDGTLVDSEEVNHRAFVQIFREFHLEDRIGVVIEGLATGRDFAGIMADIGLDPKTRRLMERRMEEIVQAVDLHVMPGAADAIRALREGGAKFSIATLNMSKKAQEILRANRMDDLFDPDLVVGSDNLPWEKPNPKVVFEVLRRSGRSQAIVVGNAPRDVMLAKNCNLPVIYLKQTVPSSRAIGEAEGAVELFQQRVRELEQRYDHQKIFWADSWAEVPALVEKIVRSV